MPIINNLSELNKVLKANENNLSQFLIGEKDFTCKNCGHLNRVKFPNNGEIKCSNCKFDIDIKFEMQE